MQNKHCWIAHWLKIENNSNMPFIKTWKRLLNWLFNDIWPISLSRIRLFWQISGICFKTLVLPITLGNFISPSWRKPIPPRLCFLDLTPSRVAWTPRTVSQFHITLICLFNVNGINSYWKSSLVGENEGILVSDGDGWEIHPPADENFIPWVDWVSWLKSLSFRCQTVLGRPKCQTTRSW